MRTNRTKTAKFYIDYLKPWHDSDKTIGVIVSGGFDSAVLWHLVYKECLKRDIKIKAFTVPKVDGSIRHANLVLEDSCKRFGTKRMETIQVGEVDNNNRDPSGEDLFLQLLSGMKEAYGWKDGRKQGGMCDVLFTGANPYAPHIIRDFGPPERNFVKGTEWESIVKQPFANYTKDWIVDIAWEEGILDDISKITHSCVRLNRGRCGECLWCVERAWAFEQNGYTDLGEN